MWAVMMAGMMIPPEVPVLLRLARTRRERSGRSPLSGTAAFLAGYLVPWTVFSLAAAALQAALQARGLMDHEMATTSRGLAAVLLLSAGAVQLSPLKRACLERCGSEATLDRASGAAAALAAGFGYGTLSIASCGLLMLILFTTGVMNLASMALLTVLLLAEKVAPRAWRLPAAVGVLLVAWGGVMLAG
jgi:predicted metal-binding membrane protein